MSSPSFSLKMTRGQEQQEHLLDLRQPIYFKYIVYILLTYKPS
jgi:hypothetical protein